MILRIRPWFPLGIVFVLFPVLTGTAHAALADEVVHAITAWGLSGLIVLCFAWIAFLGLVRRRKTVSDLRSIAKTCNFSGRVGTGAALGFAPIGDEINRTLSVLESAHLELATAREALKREMAERVEELHLTRRELETEISERRAAEARSARMNCSPDFHPDVVMELSAAGDLTHHNAAAQSLAESSGYSHPDLLLPPETAGLVKKCLADRSIQRTRAPLGARTFAWSFHPVGEPGVVHGVARDITEQARLEIELRRTRMLDGLSTHAVESANEFNNLFTIIQGYGNLIMAWENLDPALVEPVGQMIAAGERAEKLAAQLLDMDVRRSISVPDGISPLRSSAREHACGLFQPPMTRHPEAVRSATVLVVEDEAILRDLAVWILGEQGYRVLEAESAEEAHAVWSTHAGRIDLLLTDMLLPDGIPGGELARQLIARNPSLKVICTSGHSCPDLLKNQFAMSDGFHFLAKPYEPARLTRVVAEALSGDMAVALNA